MRGPERRPARACRTVTAAALLAAGLAVTTPAAAQDPGQQPAPPPGQQPTPSAPPAGQTPPAGQAPPAQTNPFMFGSDAAMLTFFIKPDKAADFEKVMAKLHEALAKSDKPERRQQAAGWKLYKAAEAGPSGTVLYVNIISPVLKGADYTISKILAEAYPQDVQQLFPLYRDAFAGLSRAELNLIEDFSGPPKPEPTPMAQ